MAEIEISGDQLVVHVTGVERVMSLRSQLEVPLDHVVGVEKGLGEAGEATGLKLLGTHVPGVVKAGTCHSHGDRLFWDAHDRGRAITITLRDENYAALVIQVDDPGGAVRTIQEAKS